MTHSVFIMFIMPMIMFIIMSIIMSIIIFIINLYLCFVFLSLSIFFLVLREEAKRTLWMKNDEDKKSVGHV